MKLLKNFMLLLSCLAIVVSCGKDDDGPAQKSVKIVASSTEVAVGEVCKFTVMSGSQDVTGKAEVYQEGISTPLAAKEFKSDKEGSYQFYAKYDGKTSEKITVKVIKQTTEGLVLKASKSQLSLDEVCTFTVELDGNDVTEKAEVYKDGEASPLAVKEFKSSTSGSYVFYAKYDGKTSAKISIEVISGEVFEGEVMLGTNTKQIIADGKESVTFTVFADGNIVTDAKIYNETTNQALESNTFSTTVAGKYSFYAMYKGKKSENPVEIVADKVGPTELPEDSAPNNFKFKRRTVAFFYTGVWCPNCPYSIKSIKDIETQEAYEDTKKQVAFVEIHGPNTNQDPYTIPAGMELATSAKVTTYPNFSFNLEQKNTGTLATSGLAQNIKKYNGVEAKVGISAVVIKETLKLKVKIGLKANTAGEYGVGAFLVEDGIYHNQSNGVVSGSQYDFNEHDNILRAASSAKDFLGDKVNIEANKTANHEISFTNINDGWKMPKCKVVIYVTDLKTKLINNAVICHVGEQVGFQY